MSPILNFEQLPSAERERTLSQRLNTQWHASRATLGFKDIETDMSGITLTSDFEAPPIIMDDRHLAQIMAFAPPTDNGRWILTMVRIYLAGGRVLYRKVDKDLFLVTIVFT